MSGIRIQGELSANVAEVDSDKNLKVNLPKVEDQSGYVRALSELDAGEVTGAPLLLSPEVSNDYRSRVGTDSIMFEEPFLGTVLNSSVWTAPVTTQAVAVAGNLLTLNSAGSVAAAGVSRVTSQRAFPIWGSYTTWFSFAAIHRTDFVSNCVMDFGLMYATGTADVTDGAFFRVTSSGTFQAIVAIGSNDVCSAVIDPGLWPTNEARDFLVGIHQDRVTFWINNILVAAFDCPVSIPTLVPSGALPITFRQYVTGSNMPQAQQLVISRASIDLGEYATARSHENAMAAMGRTALLLQSGSATVGTALSYVNNTAPVAAVPTNTTSALIASSLGGQFAETDTLVAETDGILMSFQVPAGSGTAAGRTLLVRSIRVKSMISTTLTGGGYVAQLCCAFGHTAVSLLTAESATTKASRRVPLGFQAVAANAAAGTVLSDIIERFDVPIAVCPGEFIQVVKRKVGTAPSAGVVRHLITIEGIYE